MKRGSRSQAISGMSSQICLRLARALLSIAHEDGRDVGVLRRAALEQMALDYKRRSNRRGGPHSSDHPAAGLSSAKGHTEFQRLAIERSSSGDISPPRRP